MLVNTPRLLWPIWDLPVVQEDPKLAGDSLHNPQDIPSAVPDFRPLRLGVQSAWNYLVLTQARVRHYHDGSGRAVADARRLWRVRLALLVANLLTT